MSVEELGSMVLIALIVAWVRLATGRWLADIFADLLPELVT